MHLRVSYCTHLQFSMRHFSQSTHRPGQTVKEFMSLGRTFSKWQREVEDKDCSFLALWGLPLFDFPKWLEPPLISLWSIPFISLSLLCLTSCSLTPARKDLLPSKLFALKFLSQIGFSENGIKTVWPRKKHWAGSWAGVNACGQKCWTEKSFSTQTDVRAEIY